MKMKKYQVTIFIIILFTILFSFSLATNHEPLDQSTTSTNNFEDILKNDPAKAFEQDQAKAIDSITSNPSLLDNPQVLNALKDPKVLDQAFSKNPSQISKIINKKVELLEDTNVLNKYDKAIQSDLTLLNNNPQAKIKWIGKKYNIKMDLKSSGKPVDIESYDGNNIKTGGSKGLKFRAKDFPKANVLQDGSLKTQTGLFSNVKELSIVKDSTNNPKIVMRGGSIMSQPSNSHHDLDLKDGAKMRKFVFDQGEQIPITI